ncbi:hypothetical protein AABS66_18820 [Providencia sp. SP181]
MHIPRPAKLLFQIDDGWNQLLIKNGYAVPEWTKLVIERMLACGTGLWAFAVIVALRLSALIQNISAKAAKVKVATPVV